MVTPTFLITGILSLSLVVFGISVLIRNSEAVLNQRFFAFTTSVAIWMVLNFVSAEPTLPHGLLLICNRLVLVSGVVALITLLDFVLELAGWRVRSKWRTLIIGFAWISVGLCLTPWVLEGVEISEDQVANIFGPLAFVYFLSLFLTFSAVMIVLLSGHYRISGQRKAQLDVITKSMAVVIPMVVVCNAILPILGYYGLVNIGPLSVALVVLAMYYVVAVHKLFDIRVFVFRAFAYSLSTIILGMLYIGPIVYMFDLLLGIPFELGRFLVEVVFITFAATNYSGIKKWFDVQTGKLFFRDAYDPGVVLGQLNRKLVSTLSISSLLADSSELLANSLKAEFCSFILYDTKTNELRHFGNRSKQIPEQARRRLIELLKHQNEEVVISDHLQDDVSKLRRAMSESDIALVVRLGSGDSHSSQLGYMVLGYKKSGNRYIDQDVTTLMSAADALVIAIQNALHFEEIQEFNITLQQKVDEATAKLRRTNAKLISLDETKDDFISMASHQLRTPLTAVKGYLSMVLEGDAGNVNPTQRKMLNQAYLSSQRMVYLIADLLNVSRLKTGKFVVERTEIDLATLIDQEIHQLKETAKIRGLDLSFDKPKNFPRLMLDETKTRQVIMNFIDNAIHYTPTGGHIAVELKDGQSNIELRVRDDGIGVPKAEQHHLFTKFYRAGNARRERPDGTGLGLFMAKKVIIAQGGSVLFDSRENKGSVFGFTLPKQLPSTSVVN